MGFGLLELMIVLLLVFWIFRNQIARRWPNLGRSILLVLVFTLTGIIIFDLITWMNAS